jgi:hypothetical protein
MRRNEPSEVALEPDIGVRCPPRRNAGGGKARNRCWYLPLESRPPRLLTTGLLHTAEHKWETCGRKSGTVRRPCHNNRAPTPPGGKPLSPDVLFDAETLANRGATYGRGQMTEGRGPYQNNANHLPRTTAYEEYGLPAHGETAIGEARPNRCGK